LDLENLLVSLLNKLVNLLPGGAVGAGRPGGDTDVDSFLNNHRGLLEGEKKKETCWASVTTVSARSSAHFESMAPHCYLVLYCSDQCGVQLPAVYGMVV